MNIDAFVVELYDIRHTIETAYEQSDKYSKGPLLIWNIIAFKDKVDIISTTKDIADNLDLGEIKDAAANLALLEYYITSIHTNVTKAIEARGDRAAAKIKAEVLPMIAKMLKQTVTMRANLAHCLIEDKYQ